MPEERTFLPDEELSQSMTKELGIFVIDRRIIKTVYCPKRFCHKYIEKDYINEPSQAMINGVYFETKILGRGAKGSKVTTLPKNKNGTKKAAHERLDRQADRLYGYMFAHGIRFTEDTTQVLLFAEHKKTGVTLRGEMDIFPAVTNNGKPAIIDVKSTSNIFSDFFSFNDYYIRTSSHHCWGNHQNIAMNQPIIYHYIARHFQDFGLARTVSKMPYREKQYNGIFAMCDSLNMDNTQFIFMVAGVGKKDISNQFTHLPCEYGPLQESLLEEMIVESMGRAEESMFSNYQPRPHKSLCRSCSMRDVCDSSIL